MKKLIFSIFVILVVSCTKEQTPQHVFRYNESAGILTLDPAFAKDLPHIWACNQLYNGLIELDNTMNIHPSIAKSWIISEDGLQYQFTLRDDVFFHSHKAFEGKARKVVASDFLYSFNRLIAEKTASPGAWIFNLVKRKEGQLDIEAANDSTLIIHLDRQFPAFLGLLGMAYASVVPFEVVQNKGVDFRRNPIGTGPFLFKHWEEGVRLVLRKNPNYFEVENGERLPFLEAVSIGFLTDKQTAFMEFIKGNLEFMSGIDARYKDELLTKNGQLKAKYKNKIQLIREPFLNTEYLGFNTDPSAFAGLSLPQKKALRKAINYGIDREKMLKYLRNNIGVAGHSGMIPKGLPGYDTTASIGYRYDPVLSNKWMNDYQLKGTPITISVTAEYVDLVKYIQSQLNQMGLEVKVEVLPTATLRELRAHGKLEIFRSSWVADYPDAENYLALFYSPNKSPAGPNYTQFSNAGYDRLFEASYSITDPKHRAHAYQKLDSLAMSEAPVVVLYYDEVLRFVQNRVHGLTGNPASQLDLKRVSVDNNF